MFDVELLSRIQFGFSIAFHVLFPTLNLGLALFLVIMEGAWLKTRNAVYLRLCKFWTKIFALTFGMGVVSGIVMSYQIGTNFAGFSEAVGSVLGTLFAYEVLSAFFLEAGFLAVMLFGWNKVGPKMHYAATCLVMLGTTISAFWIMSANSWMQAPAGFAYVDGKFIATDWWQVIFNPTFVPRFMHMMLASYITTCFVIGGVAAWYLLRQQAPLIAKKCFNFVTLAALVLIPIQIVMGDVVGLDIQKYQPAKTATMEALWQTQKGAPLVLFAIPNKKLEKNQYVIQIPYAASLINTHKMDGKMIGLDAFATADRPPILTVFYSFRVMVGIGLLLFALACWALWTRWRGRLYQSKALHWAFITSIPLGFVATLSGWIASEVGRQPWVVYGFLRTADAYSKVAINHVIISLSLLIIVYAVIFSFYLFYVLRVIRNGPEKPAKTDAMFTYMEQQE